MLHDFRINGLEIFSMLEEQRHPNLNFLPEIDSLEDLRLASRYDVDLSMLQQLHRLKALSLSLWNPEKISVPPFHMIGHLESLVLDWRKEFTGLGDCHGLLDLGLAGYRRRDLADLAQLVKLRRLTIKGSTLTNVSGLEGLASLKQFYIGASRSLLSLEGLSSLPQLSKLEVTGCRRLRDISYLGSLSGLRELSLVDCGQIASLRFLRNLSNLESVSILGDTEILDNDFTPLGKLSTVFLKPKTESKGMPNLSKQDAIVAANRGKLKDRA